MPVFLLSAYAKNRKANLSKAERNAMNAWYRSWWRDTRERHGKQYLTVTLGPGRTTGGIIPQEKVADVRAWIENYHKLKDHIEKISEINRELLRRQRAEQRRSERKG